MNTDNLTFSLIINTIDRAGPLKTLLQTLEHQSYPHFEVIVVVGPTQDNTLEMLSEYESRIRVLHCPKANLSQSRNIGLLAARGDIVVFIDDDAVPSQRWLEQLARLFEDNLLDATGGGVYLIHPYHPIIQHRIGIISSLAEQIDIRSSWLEHIVPPGEGSQWIARMMGTNMAFRRQALLEIGGFDESFVYIAEEADVALRLINAGKIVHPVREAVVYHIPASSRNRAVFSYVGKWWLQTRSGIYFSIKNGPTAGDSLRSIALRCLHLVHGHHLWYRQLRREGKLTLMQFLKMNAEEIKGVIEGIISGLFLPRKLIKRSSIRPQSAQQIQRFQNDNSPKQPSVDPVSGYRPSISLSEPPLRICLLSSSYPPERFDGIGRHTNLLARGLFECGHTVHVITRGERDGVSFYDGAYVHKITYRTERYARYRRLPNLYHSLNYSHAVYEKVKRLMLNDGIQIVDSPLWHFEGLVTAVSEIAPVVVRLETGLRQIAALQHDHGDDIRLMGEVERLLIEQASHLIPNTQATLDAVRKAYGVRLMEYQYTIVPHGIIPAPDEDIHPFDLKRLKDTFTVLYVGRLEKRKGIKDLFKAIPLVVRQVPNVKFVIVGGDNSQHDGFQRRMGMDYPTFFAKHYEKFIPFVEFTGVVSDEKLQALYKSCDLFVAPSLYESFGLIYLEAMNYAKPVIGCCVGGIPEVVDDGVTGLLVEPETPAALAEAIVLLLKSPVKLYEMGLAGRERLMERFTYIQMARNFERVYRAVIRTSKAQKAGLSFFPPFPRRETHHD
jgi:hypothetical protein